MSTSHSHSACDSQRQQKQRRLRWLMLQLALLGLTTACSSNNGDEQRPAEPPPVVSDAQFADEPVAGLGFAAGGVVEGVTDSAGRFKAVQGKSIEFFLGAGTRRLVIGSLTPAVQAGQTLQVSLHDLRELQGPDDAALGNLLAVLAAADVDQDISNGVTITATTHDKVAAAVAGKTTLPIQQAAATFSQEPVVKLVFAALDRKFFDIDELLAQFTLLFRQARSSTIALTSDDRRAVVVNRQKGTVSVLQVRAANGADTESLLGEVEAGREPRFVALSPDDRRAYVTNAIDGAISVIDLTGAAPRRIGPAVHVGVEPRGIAITPNGNYAFVALHTAGEVAIVRLATLEVVRRVPTGGNPYSIAITNDGDRNDLDERVFVTRLFGEQIDASRPDGFDDAKQGVIDTLSVGAALNGAAPLKPLTIAPLLSGFTADRRPFCLATRRALQDAGSVKFFNSGANGAGDGASQLANQTFCPDPNSTDASADGPIGRHPQKAYPNMLFASLLRGSQLYVVNVGASPEPPVRFNVNVQAMVGVINRVKGLETDRSLNLNAQIVRETQPAETALSLDRLFLNDMVAVDADRFGRQFLFVSRGGNFVIRARLGDDGKLTILESGNRAIRMQTGHMPTGIVMSRDRTRAYTNNEISTSVTALNLATNAVIARDIEASTPPAPGTLEHRRLVGKLAFFTALGLPDKLDNNGDGSFDVALRAIDPLAHRNKASDNAWSSCASCHDDGHSDNVTWIFETGPRQTISLEGTFARNDANDQRILNWSGVRGANTDFNNNARGIQGGKGFATDVGGVNRTARVFNHGPVTGVSDSLDAMHEWVQTVRAPIAPDLSPAADAAGRALFVEYCATCHGGAKWTKSRTSPLYQNNATFPEDPIGVNFFVGVRPVDAGVVAAGPQIVSVTRNGKGTLKLLDNVGTFNAQGPLEIRGAAAVAGQSTQGFAAFGALGFNTPSLLGVAYSGPYLHDGSAVTLEQVAAKHVLRDGKFIAQVLTAEQVRDLLAFVRAIDNQTPTVESETDRFLKN